MSSRGREERGAAALLVLTMTGVLLLVAAVLAVAGAMVVDHRRAQAAADLAALAGASAAARGDSECEVAGEVAEANGAHMRECSVDGLVVTVTVTVRGPRWLGQRGDLEASARAGPA